MKPLRFIALAFIGAIGFLLTPVIFKRMIAVSLCGVLGATSPGCYVLGQSRVVAATPTKLIAQGDIFNNPDAGNNNSGASDVDIFNNSDAINDAAKDAAQDVINQNNAINDAANDAAQDVIDLNNAVDDIVRDIVSPSPNSSIQYVRSDFQSPVYVYFVNGIRVDNVDYADTVNLISSRLLTGIVDPPVIDLPTHNPTATIS
ncbi:MAG: hypothetical protein F6K65_31095 [Moorea sp. SIO3C2]|nr:hypothetical protein [Moorena sp. SIO3C2]